MENDTRAGNVIIVRKCRKGSERLSDSRKMRETVSGLQKLGYATSVNRKSMHMPARLLFDLQIG
jgi:hypothetical protein